MVLLLVTASGDTRAQPTSAAASTSVKRFKVNDKYGTLGFRGTISRSNAEDHYEYSVHLEVVFDATAKFNRAKAIRLTEAQLVATRMKNDEQWDVLSRDTKPVSLDFAEDGETKELPDLTFRLEKTIAAQATHVGVVLSDGRMLWPVGTELK